MCLCESACVRVLVPDDKPWNKVLLLCRGFFIRPQLYCFSVWVEASSHKECFHLVPWTKPFPPHHRQFSLSAVPFFFLPSFHCNTIWGSLHLNQNSTWMYMIVLLNWSAGRWLSALVENIIMYACMEAKLILMQDVRLTFAFYLCCECSCGSDIITWNRDIGEFKSKLAVAISSGD